MKVDFKLLTIALLIIGFLTLITFIMKSVLVEIMLPFLMVALGLYALYLLYSAILGGQNE